MGERWRQRFHLLYIHPVADLCVVRKHQLAIKFQLAVASPESPEIRSSCNQLRVFSNALALA
jgi:hypothetical protein